MSLDELSRKSYLLEDWYTDQAEQWNELSAKGWEFTKPPFIPGSIGIRMKRGRDFAEFRVGADLTVREIHNQLLKCCVLFDSIQEATECERG